MTALEDPSEIGSELPPGAGRIQMPGGDVRSFQFQPPSPEDQNEALRQAAQRQMQFDVQKRIAEQAAQDEQYLRDLQISALADEQKKVIEAAEQSIAMRRLQRDYAAAKASGMPEDQAYLQAAMNNTRAVGGGRAVAQIADAFKRIEPPSFDVSPGGREYGFNPRTGTLSWAPNPPREPPDRATQPPTPMERLGYLQRRAAALLAETELKSKNDPAVQAKLAEREQIMAQLERVAQQFGLEEGSAVPASKASQIAPPPGLAPSPVPARKEASALPNLRVGTIYKGYRFNGKYVPGDRRAWDRVQ